MDDNRNKLPHPDGEQCSPIGIDYDDDNSSDCGSNVDRITSKYNGGLVSGTGSRSMEVSCGGDHTRCGIDCDACSGGSGGTMSTLAMIILSYNNNDPKMAMNNVQRGAFNSKQSNCNIVSSLN